MLPADQSEMFVLFNLMYCCLWRLLAPARAVRRAPVPVIRVLPAVRRTATTSAFLLAPIHAPAPRLPG